MSAKELGQQPAFPFVKVSESATHCNDASAEGMTLRTHIASMALQGLIASNFYDRYKADSKVKLHIVDIACSVAIEYADALLNQLAGEPT